MHANSRKDDARSAPARPLDAEKIAEQSSGPTYAFTEPSHQQHGLTEQTPATSVMTGHADATAGGDEVTEESQQFFPASDPPSWTPARL